jgi:hypothetical protein
MMLPRTFFAAFCLAAGALLAPAHATNLHSFVSSTGTGSACTRDAPCAGLGTAQIATSPGGIITVLDPASNYGGLTITKSLTIECPACGTSILAFRGFTINAGANDVVTLRGLGIDGASDSTPGENGVIFNSGKQLQIENCTFRNQLAAGGTGIYFKTSASARLLVSDSVITNNGVNTVGNGIYIRPTGGYATVVLKNVKVEGNANGLTADSQATSGALLITAADSSFSANNGYGIALLGNGGAAQSSIMLKNTLSIGNTTGVFAAGSNSTIFLTGSVLSSNNAGIVAQNGGKIVSYRDNAFGGNFSAITPTATAAND